MSLARAGRPCHGCASKPAQTPSMSRHGGYHPQCMDLSPARWIWFPGKRTLQNTFILFRRDIELPSAPKRATGWITADSRYRLTVNGQRIQWGPAPCDPRWQDVDPIDLTSHLVAGKNVIGVEVLYYG